MPQWLSKIPPDIGYYLSGFTDGEGSFNVSLRKRGDHAAGWQVVLTFNVSQRDQTVLSLLKRHLGCGRLFDRGDGVWYFVVTNYHSINDRIIPFFERFGFLSSSKKRNFRIFKEITRMLSKGEHLKSGGLAKIVSLRETINIGRGRKRKYSEGDYQQSLIENPQRLIRQIPSDSKDEAEKIESDLPGDRKELPLNKREE
ncbi:MAG TPA: LAGLIDADG family homing endonuclease [Candidatus Paceibacterota bacterium]